MPSPPAGSSLTALDTNVLIYACDSADPVPQQKAPRTIEATEDGVLLWQVACEFVAASRKLAAQGFTPVHAWERLSEYLSGSISMGLAKSAVGNATAVENRLR